MKSRKIVRYFDPTTFSKIKHDFDFLFPLLQGYFGEIEFSIRNNYFNLYYKGNSLSMVKCTKTGSYKVSINKKFFNKSKAQSDKLFDFKLKGDSFKDDLSAKLLHPFFKKKYINDFCSKIRIVNNGEEINFEQSIITDNIDNQDFFIIDRQITDTDLMRKRMDLLALKKTGDGIYKFVVLEVKLGKNDELEGKVASQLAHYIDHIKLHLDEYAACYEKNYEQKKELGLLSIPFKSIKIDRNDVEGIVVVGGYSKIADKYIATLNSKHSLNIKQYKFNLS
jgi:CRISPR/Cas system-associated exonuclease Cas4 (RecB family)